MFVMGYIFNLPETHMLCEPDKKRGQQLLANILKGGNFGKHSKEQNLSVMNRWLADRIRPFKRFSFDFSESLWHEYRYIIDFIRYMPKRIRYGKISVKKV